TAKGQEPKASKTTEISYYNKYNFEFMLQVNFIRENKERVLAGLAKRNKDFSAQIDEILALDDARKKAQNELDNNLAEANKLSKEIGEMFKSERKDDAEGLKPRVAELKEAAKGLEETLSKTEE